MTAAHLAAKFKDVVKVLIIDRSFCELRGVGQSKLKGSMTSVIFNALTCSWKCENENNFAKADCYKIVTCDPEDDTVDHFENTVIGVAKKVAKHDYNTKDFKLFFDSLLFTINYERTLYLKLTQVEKEGLYQKIVTTVQDLEADQVQKVDTDIEILEETQEMDETKFMFEKVTENSNRTNITKSSQASRFSIEFIKSRSPSTAREGPFFDLIHLLFVLLCEL